MRSTYLGTEVRILAIVGASADYSRDVQNALESLGENNFTFSHPSPKVRCKVTHNNYDEKCSQLKKTYLIKQFIIMCMNVYAYYQTVIVVRQIE